MAPGASKPVARFDLGTLRPVKRLADGRLRADAYISRAGIHEYRGDDGKVRRELRPPEEVFDPASLSSFAQVPVTNDHPAVGLLTSNNARSYMVGSTGEQVLRDDDHARTSLMVADSDTVKQMENGKVEVSCGYTCDVDDTPGTHPVYGKYDAIQRNIRGYHVAIVHSARAGKSARVRLDGAAEMIRRDEPTSFDAAPTRRKDNMKDADKDETIRALGAQLTEAKEKADEATNKLKEAQTRADVAEGRLLVADGRISELQTTLSVRTDATETEAVAREKQRADAAEAKVARFDATIEKRVRERSKLERQAYVVLGDEFRMDDLADREIMAAVVKRLDSNADVSTGVADGIVQGRFLALIDGHAKNARSQARVAEILGNDDRGGSPRLDSKEEKKKAIRDQWKTPLPNDIRASRGKEA